MMHLRVVVSLLVRGRAAAIVVATLMLVNAGGAHADSVQLCPDAMSGKCAGAVNPANDCTAAPVVGSLPWGNPQQAGKSDAKEAAQTLAKNDHTNTLRCTNYSEGVPEGSRVDGIELNIERLAGAANRISDFHVQLIRPDGQLTLAPQGDHPTTTFWPKLHFWPMRQPGRTCEKCQIFVPSPMSFGSSTTADSWTK